jgi:hypothetical protein
LHIFAKRFKDRLEGVYWAEEGRRYRRSQCFWTAAVDEVERMACIEKTIGVKARGTTMNASLTDTANPMDQIRLKTTHISSK